MEEEINRKQVLYDRYIKHPTVETAYAFLTGYAFNPWVSEGIEVSQAGLAITWIQSKGMSSEDAIVASLLVSLSDETQAIEPAKSEISRLKTKYPKWKI